MLDAKKKKNCTKGVFQRGRGAENRLEAGAGAVFGALREKTCGVRSALSQKSGMLTHAIWVVPRSSFVPLVGAGLFCFCIRQFKSIKRKNGMMLWSGRD